MNKQKWKSGHYIFKYVTAVKKSLRLTEEDYHCDNLMYRTIRMFTLYYDKSKFLTETDILELKQYLLSVYEDNVETSTIEMIFSHILKDNTKQISRKTNGIVTGHGSLDAGDEKVYVMRENKHIYMTIAYIEST